LQGNAPAISLSSDANRIAGARILPEAKLTPRSGMQAH
jgi:hypothetical protein